MTNLVLVRHGETVWHGENRYAGRTDVELSERGLAQAAALARWAKTAELAAIWCSPLGRARRTADACAAVTGLAVRVDARLRELDFGAAEGLTRDEMRHRFPEALTDFQRDPVGHHLPEGEDPERAAGRFVGCLRDIAREHPDGRVLVVAHSTVIRLALCALIGVPLARYRQLFPAMPNCAPTELRLGAADERAAVLTVNAPLEGEGL